MWEAERREACWDLPCSSCSCRWRTCWRVAVRRWAAFTPVPARRFYAPERQAAALCVRAPSQHAHKASLKGLTMSQRVCVRVCVCTSTRGLLLPSSAGNTNNAPVCTFTTGAAFLEFLKSTQTPFGFKKQDLSTTTTKSMTQVQSNGAGSVRCQSHQKNT